MWKRPAAMACIADIGILLLAPFLIFFFGFSTSVVFGIAIALIAIVTFGFFYSEAAVGEGNDRTVRTAVTATFVIVYFVFLALFTFSPQLREYVEGTGQETGEITEERVAAATFGRELFSTFTTLVGTVVSFYVASTAVVEATASYGRAKVDAAQAAAAATPQPQGSSSATPPTV